MLLPLRSSLPVLSLTHLIPSPASLPPQLPDYPIFDKRVRATVELSAWVVSPVTPFKSNVTYVACVDLKGSIPLKIKNKFMTQEAMWVADVSRYFQRILTKGKKGEGGETTLL